MTKIETIFTHRTDNGIKGELGIDNSGRLYWNKKLVITKSKIVLGWWVNISVIIASLSTLIMAIYTILDYYKPCAMAKQAEAEREKRSKIIAAEGELLASEKLGHAADIMAQHPIALQLRNLQTLAEISIEKNSTIIFPAQLMTAVEDIKKFINKEQATKN